MVFKVSRSSDLALTNLPCSFLHLFECLQMGVPGVALGLAWTQVGGKVSRWGREILGLGFNPIGFENCILENREQEFSSIAERKNRGKCSCQVMVVEASKVPTHASREGKLKLTGQVQLFLRAAQIQIQSYSARICHAGISRACTLLDQVPNFFQQQLPNCL